MASTIADEPLVREHERIVDKLNGRHFLGAYHHLERFNPLTNRRGNRRIGGGGISAGGGRRSKNARTEKADRKTRARAGGFQYGFNDCRRARSSRTRTYSR